MEKGKVENGDMGSYSLQYTHGINHCDTQLCCQASGLSYFRCRFHASI